jgi:hypothetical protein
VLMMVYETVASLNKGLFGGGMCPLQRSCPTGLFQIYNVLLLSAINILATW